MKAFNRISIGLLVGGLALAAALLTTACTSSGSGSSRTYIHYGAGYRGFYRHPWGYPPRYIGGGIGGGAVDPDWGVEPPGGPVALPMPDMGMPDFDMMDMGDFDW